MKRLVYQVAVGPPRPLWEKCLASMAAYCARHGIAHHVQREPILRVAPKASQRSASALKLGFLPNCEKLAGLNHLAAFDSVAIVDSDVWAREDAPDIFADVPDDCDVAGVTERSLAVTPQYARKLDGYERAQFGPLDGVGLPFLQCGVLVYRRSVLRLFPLGPQAWWGSRELEPFVNGAGAWRWTTEQTPLCWHLRRHGARVHLLSPRWNALYGAITRPALDEAFWVHFFLSSHLTGVDPVAMARTGTARPRV